MSILARNTCAPSANSPERIRANRSKFSVMFRSDRGSALRVESECLEWPGFLPHLDYRHRLFHGLSVLLPTRTADRSNRRRGSGNGRCNRIQASGRRLEWPGRILDFLCPDSCRQNEGNRTRRSHRQCRSSGTLILRGRCAGSHLVRGEAGDDGARIFPVSNVGPDNLVYKTGSWRIGVDHGRKSISYGASSLQTVEV